MIYNKLLKHLVPKDDRNHAVVLYKIYIQTYTGSLQVSLPLSSEEYLREEA